MQLPPSRLTLGTAQLGLDYGVANRSGLPSFKVVCDIIREAHLGGIDVIDTAPSYGESEELIGRALRELHLQEHMRVMTKISALPPGLTRQEAARQIEASVVCSLKRLAMDRVPICLFHRENDIQFADELLALQAKGLIEMAGVSLGHAEFAWKAVKLSDLRVWQIATNVLDRRYTHSGILAAAKQAGVVIFVRSVYLQGLLLIDDDRTPGHLREIIGPRRRLREIAARFQLSMEEIAMRTILSRSEIDSVVVGMETIAQIRDNVGVCARGMLPAEVLAALESLELNVPEFVITPFEWKRAQADFDNKAARRSGL